MKKKYDVVEDAIIEHIRISLLAEGAKLPTYRELADQFNCSTYTVATAVDSLQGRGILDVRPQAGIFVAKDAWGIIFPDEIRWDKYVSTKIHPNATQKAYIQSSSPFQLHNYSLSSEFNWYPLLENSIQESLKSLSYPDDLNDPMGAYGYPPLRAELENHLQSYGIDTLGNTVLPTCGMFSGLRIVASALFSKEDICFVPSPSVFEHNIFMHLFVGKSVPVPCDEDGMSVEYISARIPKNRKAYLIVSPVIQSMCGVTMSLHRRRHIYKLCHENGIPIIEIEEYRDLHPNPLPSLKAMDKHNIVINIGSFSKILSESLNVGWLIVPDNIAKDIVIVRLSYFDHFNMFDQMIAYHALSDGKYRKLAAEIRPMLQMRYKAFNEVLQKHLGDIANWNKHSNAFFWLKFVDYIDTCMMTEKATNIGFFDHTFYTHVEKNSILVTALHHSIEELDEAIEKLSFLARSCVK